MCGIWALFKDFDLTFKISAYVDVQSLHGPTHWVFHRKEIYAFEPCLNQCVSSDVAYVCTHVGIRW
jgi:hypothetical protein